MHRQRKHIAIWPAGNIDYFRGECGHDGIWMKGAGCGTWLPMLLPSVYSSIDSADFTFSSFRPLPLADPDCMPVPSNLGWTLRLIAPIGGAYPQFWGGVIFSAGHKPSVCLDKFAPESGGIKRVLQNFFSEERIDLYRRADKPSEEIWIRHDLKICDLMEEEEPYPVPAWLRAIQGLEPVEAQARMNSLRFADNSPESYRRKRERDRAEAARQADAEEEAAFESRRAEWVREHHALHDYADQLAGRRTPILPQWERDKEELEAAKDIAADMLIRAASHTEAPEQAKAPEAAIAQPAPETPPTPQPEKTLRERVAEGRKKIAKHKKIAQGAVAAAKANKASAEAWAAKRVAQLEKAGKL